MFKLFVSFILTLQIPCLQISGERWIDEEARVRGIEAVLEFVPEGINAKDFANLIAQKEGLIPIPGPFGYYNTERSSIGVFSVISAQGPNIRVYYRADITEFDQKFVCVIREKGFGISDSSWRASRWCALSIGAEWPERPSPPVINQSKQ